jgi:hypothetical protein
MGCVVRVARVGRAGQPVPAAAYLAERASAGGGAASGKSITLRPGVSSDQSASKSEILRATRSDSPSTQDRNTSNDSKLASNPDADSLAEPVNTTVSVASEKIPTFSW